MIRVVLPEHINTAQPSKNDKEFEIFSHKLEIHDGWKLFLVMVVSKQEKIMENITQRIVGDFYCYRHHLDTKIKFRRFKEFDKEYEINLKNLITEKSLTKFITFDGLKKQSHLRFKENHFKNLLKDKNKNLLQTDPQSEKLDEPSHWLNVSV